MSGWIKLHRDLFDKPIWLKSTSQQRSILIALLAMANHKSREWEWQGEKFSCRPGQFVTSAASIAAKSGNDITRQNVRSALARFEKLDFLTIKSTKTGCLITLVNWGLYQGEDEQPNQVANQEVTKTQPRGNQEVTTNKNDKNDKNENNDKEVINTTTSKNAFSEYQSIWGIPNTRVIEELISWVETFDNEIVCKAIELSSHAHWPYVRKILNDWKRRGFKTITDVERAEAEFNAKKNKPKQYKQVKQEIIPEWFEKDYVPPEPKHSVEFPEGLRKLMEEGRKEKCNGQ